MIPESHSLLFILLVSGIMALASAQLWRFFQKKDARQMVEQEKAATAFVKVSEVTVIEELFVTTIQNAVIYGFYGACIVTVLLETGIFFAALSGQPMSLLDVAVFPFYSMSITWSMLTCTYVVVLLLRRRGGYQPPHLLFSLRYSVTSALLVDQVGFDGLFALPWRLVVSIERIDEMTLRIVYLRRPRLLSALIRANRLTLLFNNTQDIEQILLLWETYTEHK